MRCNLPCDFFSNNFSFNFWFGFRLQALSALERVFGPLDILKSDLADCAECHDDMQPILNDKKDTAARATYEKV